MTIEVPRTINIDYSLGHILQEVFEKVDGALKLEEKQCTAFVNHITNYLMAIETGGKKKFLEKVRESRQILKETGVSEVIISDSEIIAVGQVVENLADKTEMYRSQE